MSKKSGIMLATLGILICKQGFAADVAPKVAWLPSDPGIKQATALHCTDGVRLNKAGKWPTALFPGKPDEMAVFNAPIFTNLTITAWVRLDGMGEGDKLYPRIVNTPGFHLLATAPLGGLNMAGLTLGMVIDGKTTNWSLNSNITTGQWVHVAVSCATGASFAPNFYVNGEVRADSLLLTKKMMTTAIRGGKAAFGNSLSGTRPFHGALADLRLYDAVLSGADIRKLARLTPDGIPPTKNEIVYHDELPVKDVAGDQWRHTIVAEGTESIYQGHATTLLMPDNRTMFAVWTIGHGGNAGPAARSDDGGKTWSRIDDIFPAVYRTHRNCPAIYRILAPDNRAHLLIFSNKHGVARMISEDDGASWRELPQLPLKRVGMPFTGLIRLKDGNTAAFGQVGREIQGAANKRVGQSVFMVVTKDGGLSFDEPRVIATKPGKDLCEPFVLRSSDGNELCCLMRENVHQGNSMMCFSRDEGESWSEPVDTPWGLTGDRHEGVQTSDGRWVIAFRDRALRSSTYGHFVAWVGSYEDIRECLPGQYRIKLLHNYAGADCGYPGMEILKDDTILATTYLKYWPDERKHSVVMTRFKLSEL